MAPLDAITTRSTAQDHLIVALDFPSAAAALSLADRLTGRVRWVKVGLELYLAAGQPVVDELTRRGFQVFLDLKLHDIPNTVAGAIRSVGRSGASLLTVHTAGGPIMLEAARQAAAEFPGLKLLAVTVLTSMDAGQLQAIGVADTPERQVLRLARLAADAGISDLVCSPAETCLLREHFGPQPLLVVPGIRPAGNSLDDQKRAATPAAALSGGASMLVVGRPITQAPDPVAAVASILTEMSQEA